MVALHLAIDGHRLRLHATHRAEHEHGAVQDAQAALDLDREIDVAGRVDQVDRAVFPLDCGGGAGDRDAALAFEVHVVHRRAPFALDLLDPVDPAGVIQDALAQGGFARVDVGRNADVAQFREVHDDNLRQFDYLVLFRSIRAVRATMDAGELWCQSEVRRVVRARQNI